MLVRVVVGLHDRLKFSQVGVCILGGGWKSHAMYDALLAGLAPISERRGHPSLSPFLYVHVARLPHV